MLNAWEGLEWQVTFQRKESKMWGVAPGVREGSCRSCGVAAVPRGAQRSAAPVLRPVLPSQAAFLKRAGFLHKTSVSLLMRR